MTILQVSLLYFISFCWPKATSDLSCGMQAEALTGKAVGDEEQRCRCAVQQMQLLFLCPLKPSFSGAKGAAHWLCLPRVLASCELKGTWSPATFLRFTVLILQHWGFCYALWDVASHDADLRQLGEVSYGDCFKLYFATFVMKRKSVGAVCFSWKRVWISCKWLWAVSCGKWEETVKMTLLRSCENTFMLRDFICYQVGLALHITPQNRRFTEVHITLFV